MRFIWGLTHGCSQIISDGGYKHLTYLMPGIGSHNQLEAGTFGLFRPLSQSLCGLFMKSLQDVVFTVVRLFACRLRAPRGLSPGRERGRGSLWKLLSPLRQWKSWACYIVCVRIEPLKPLCFQGKDNSMYGYVLKQS